MRGEESGTSMAATFAGLAHEMRNPLQGIMASLAALSCKVEEDPTLQPFLEMINHEISRMNQIIDGMLELSQPIHIDPSPHSILRLLEEAIRSATSRFENAPIGSIELDAPESV